MLDTKFCLKFLHYTVWHFHTNLACFKLIAETLDFYLLMDYFHFELTIGIQELIAL